MVRHPSTTTRRQLIRATWLLGAGAALGAAALPSITSVIPPARARQDVADPTRTREAELTELSSLRTQVSEQEVCTPVDAASPVAPSATDVPATTTATPVPPAAVGTRIAYGDRFDITVLGIAPLPANGELDSQGQLLQVNLTIVNTTRDAEPPPFNDWLLIDVSGQAYEVDRDASREIGGRGWELNVAPGELASRSIVFDVLPNTGTTFTLESRDEPTFRVALTIESRG